MIKQILFVAARMLLILLILAIVVLGVSQLAAEIYARTRTFSVEATPAAPVAIVFGAGLYRNGTPTPVLQDRVATAARLYFAGKVKKILMSGDNRTIYYNEPGAMREYALKLGVPEADIVLDYAGWRTYDTCYRARAIFALRQVVVVTQDFHLPRAVLLCNAMGIQATGVSADLRVYPPGPALYWQLRELPAVLVSFWDIWVSHPLPVLGNPEPIFPGQAASRPFE